MDKYRGLRQKKQIGGTTDTNNWMAILMLLILNGAQARKPGFFVLRRTQAIALLTRGPPLLVVVYDLVIRFDNVVRAARLGTRTGGFRLARLLRFRGRLLLRLRL